MGYKFGIPARTLDESIEHSEGFFAEPYAILQFGGWYIATNLEHAHFLADDRRKIVKEISWFK